MKISVFPNYSKVEASDCTREIIDILEKRGCEILLREYKYEFIAEEIQGDKELCSADILLAIGGDGTIIHTAKMAAYINKPVLGVNAGNMGFTAGVERNELHLLPNLIEGKSVLNCNSK